MNWWQRIGGPNGITFRAWLLLSPISIIFTAEVVPEGYLEGWSRLDGLIVGTLAHLATGAVLFLGKYVIKKFPGDNPKPLATIAVMGLSGAARGVVTSVLLETFEITAQADLQDRIASGAALIIIWFSATAVVVDSRQRYRESFESLSERVEQQRLLRERGSEILEQRESQLIGQVRQTLQEALRIGANTADIHNAVDSLVRPLAHSISLSRPEITVPARPKARIKFWPIAKTAFATTPFNAGPVIYISVLGTFYSKLWQLGLLGVIDSMLSALFIFVFFRLGQRLGSFGWWAWLIWFAAGITSGLTTGLFSGVNPLENPSPALYLSLNVLIPAVLAAFLQAYDTEAEKNLTKLQEILDSVQWQTVALQQQAWVQQKRIARFVHSDLQARIRAFALRLELAGSQPRPEDIAKLREECEASLALGGEYQDFEKFITELRELWDGVLQITFEAGADERKLISEDGFAQIALVEIVREAVSNSVKHGKATEVKVTLDRESETRESCLRAIVADNGRQSAANGKGMGSQVLSELTLSWQLDKGANGATLTALVPVRELEMVA